MPTCAASSCGSIRRTSRRWTPSAQGCCGKIPISWPGRRTGGVCPRTSAPWTRTRRRCCAARCWSGRWTASTVSWMRRGSCWPGPWATVGTTRSWRRWCWSSMGRSRAMPGLFAGCGKTEAGGRSFVRKGTLTRRPTPPFWGGSSGAGRPSGPAVSRTARSACRGTPGWRRSISPPFWTWPGS